MARRDRDTVKQARRIEVERMKTLAGSEFQISDFLAIERLDRNRDNRSLGGKHVLWRLLSMFGARAVGCKLRDLGYSRMEYLEFLVNEARNPLNSVEFRFAAFERLDRLARVVGCAHPKMAEWMALDPLERRSRVRGLRLKKDRDRLMTAKRNIEHRVREIDGVSGPVLLDVSPFVAYQGDEVEREKRQKGACDDG